MGEEVQAVRPPIWLALTATVLLGVTFAVQALVDIRLNSSSSTLAILLISAVEFVAVSISIVAWSRPEKLRQMFPHTQKHWLHTGIATSYVLGCHCTGLACALGNPDLRAVTGQHFLRTNGIVVFVVFAFGLRPKKTWVLLSVTLLPLLLQLAMLGVSNSWEERHRDAFLFMFVIETAGSIVILGLALTSSYRSVTAYREARSLRDQLIAKAARSQSFLETAMPPLVAQQLLSGTPAFELTRSYPDVSVAFVCLVDYESKSIKPLELISWLDAVYSAFDGLVDAYDDRINKVEVSD
jgi:NADH:ubiquinone oxidoreductase subunit K